MYYGLFRDMTWIVNPHEKLSSRYGHEELDFLAKTCCQYTILPKDKEDLH